MYRSASRRRGRLRGVPSTDATRVPYEIGERYEQTLSSLQRRQGAHFTPRDVASSITRRAIELWGSGGRRTVPTVCDPACGGGVFLVAAADELLALGADATEIVNELILGIDIDPGAVEASSAALEAWAAEHGACDVRPRVVAGDALAVEPGAFGRIDVVVGNPPFQSQLERRTARTEAERRRLKERFGAAASGYVDIASLFALWAIQRVEPGGVVGLILPRSFLVARDALAIRRELLRSGEMPAVWLPGSKIFTAHVDVCATFHRRHRGGDVSPGGTTTVVGGRSATLEHGRVERAELEEGETWSAVWALAQGVPGVRHRRARAVTPLGSVATATAGFRDQYYGLLDHLRDERPTNGAKVASTAMIDPAACRWTEVDVVIARRRRSRPWLDLDALLASNASLRRWVDAQLVPKVLVATQTRIIEAAADERAEFVPLTPVISVTPAAGGHSAAHLEAALLAPAASAWALRQFGGGGMSSSALKLAARQVLEIPLPSGADEWDEGVALISSLRAGLLDETRRDRWREIGTVLNGAWGLSTGAESGRLVDWWIDRLPASVRG